MYGGGLAGGNVGGGFSGGAPVTIGGGGGAPAGGNRGSTGATPSHYQGGGGGGGEGGDGPQKNSELLNLSGWAQFCSLPLLIFAMIKMVKERGMAIGLLIPGMFFDSVSLVLTEVAGHKHCDNWKVTSCQIHRFRIFAYVLIFICYGMWIYSLSSVGGVEYGKYDKGSFWTSGEIRSMFVFFSMPIFAFATYLIWLVVIPEAKKKDVFFFG